VPADRLRAERPDHVCALDFQFNQTADGRIVKLLHVVDESPARRSRSSASGGSTLMRPWPSRTTWSPPAARRAPSGGPR